MAVGADHGCRGGGWGELVDVVIVEFGVASLAELRLSDRLFGERMPETVAVPGYEIGLVGCGIIVHAHAVNTGRQRVAVDGHDAGGVRVVAVRAGDVGAVVSVGAEAR